jgi:hypothetical protein
MKKITQRVYKDISNYESFQFKIYLHYFENKTFPGLKSILQFLIFSAVPGINIRKDIVGFQPWTGFCSLES